MPVVLNFMDLVEIDITPAGAARTWKALAAGIESFDASNNDNLDQRSFMNDNGYGNSEVIGKQFTLGFSGVRVWGDAAQDWLESISSELGDAVKSSLRITDAFGNVKTASCTFGNLVVSGGEAGARSTFSGEIHAHGKPARTPKAAAAALTATVAAGSVIGTTKFTATAGAGNSLAYKLSAATAGAIYGGQYLSGQIAYTSAANIAATAGQFLQMYELDANGRVAKYAEDELAAGDIAST